MLKIVEGFIIYPFHPVRFFSWLQFLFSPPSVPVFLSPSALTPAPVSPPAPLTQAERQAQHQQRLLSFELGLAEQFHQDVLQDRDISDEPSADLLQAICLLGHNQADLQLARRWGHVEEELRLLTEAQELEATAQFLLWQHCLCETFGLRIGIKLSQHQIEPGMTWDMVTASYGAPAEGAITVLAPETYRLHYGHSETGSVIELCHGIVTRAQLGAVAFPAYVYDLPTLTGPDGVLQPPAIK